MKYLVLLAALFSGQVFGLKPNNVTVFNASSNATKVSSVIDAQFISSGSLQASFSDAAAAGTLVLQCSNDVVKPTHWSTCLNGSSTGSVAVTAGALTYLSLQWLNARWLRVSWTSTGGAGTFNVYGMFQGY